MKARAVVFVTLPLLLAGCAGASLTSPSPPAVSESVADAAGFTRIAVSSNLLEIESSRLALQRSRDPEIRRFAARMVRDHGQASQRMAATLRRGGLPSAPETLTVRHKAKLEELGSADADGFDGAYVALQAEAHQEAIALFSGYAQSGDDHRLAEFARRTLPTLQMHAQHVERIDARGRSRRL